MTTPVSLSWRRPSPSSRPPSRRRGVSLSLDRCWTTWPTSRTTSVRCHQSFRRSGSMSSLLSSGEKRCLQTLHRKKHPGCDSAWLVSFLPLRRYRRNPIVDPSVLTDRHRDRLYRSAVRVIGEGVPFNLKTWVCCAGRCANAGRCYRARLCKGEGMMVDPEWQMYEALDGEQNSVKMGIWR